MIHAPLRVSLVLPVVNGLGLQEILDILTEVNRQFLLSHPSFPGLYESGVIYQEEPPGQEEFCACPDVLRRGWGDCDDLAPWRAAQLQTIGIPARARVYMVGPLDWHCDVVRPDGIEDPSRVLGMR